MVFFWVKAPCNLVEVYHRFRGPCCLHHQGDEQAARGLLIALMMEAAGTSETLVNFYRTTRRYNPEDSHLRTHRRENLKSYYIQVINGSLKIIFIILYEHQTIRLYLFLLYYQS
jgi:hypothetical protein